MLPDAIGLMKAWGFTFKSAGTWAKQSSTGRAWAFGTGYCFRSAAEFFLLGTIGTPKVKSRSIRNLMVAPVREHSRKPDQQFDNAEQLYDGPYSELFSRTARPGWDAWGPGSRQVWRNRMNAPANIPIASPFSVPQLAHRWGCSEGLIRKMIRDGRLHCFRPGTLIQMQDLQPKWRDSNVGAASNDDAYGVQRLRGGFALVWREDGKRRRKQLQRQIAAPALSFEPEGKPDTYMGEGFADDEGFGE